MLLATNHLAANHLAANHLPATAGSGPAPTPTTTVQPNGKRKRATQQLRKQNPTPATLTREGARTADAVTGRTTLADDLVQTPYVVLLPPPSGFAAAYGADARTRGVFRTALVSAEQPDGSLTMALRPGDVITGVDRARWVVAESTAHQADGGVTIVHEALVRS